MTENQQQNQQQVKKNKRITKIDNTQNRRSNRSKKQYLTSNKSPKDIKHNHSLEKQNIQQNNTPLQKYLSTKLTRYRFYIKTPFPYHFKQKKIFPKSKNKIIQLKKYTQINYVDSHIYLFTKNIYGQIIPKCYNNQIRDSLKDLQSIFILTKCIQINQNQPILKLIKRIRQINPQTNIFVQYSDESNWQKWNQIKLKQYPNMKFINKISNTFKNQIQQCFSNNKTIFFKLPYEQQKHFKLWFMKFKMNNSKYMLRIVITTSNFSSIDQNHGKNIFWSGQYEILNQNYFQKIKYNLSSQEYKQQDKLFKNQLCKMLKFQIKQDILKALGIQLQKVKFKNTNCYIISSQPFELQIKQGMKFNPTQYEKCMLSKIKTYSQQYFKQKLNKNYSFNKYPSIHLFAPDFQGCKVQQLNSIFESFFPNFQFDENNKNKTLLYINYPTNDYIKKKLYHQFKYKTPRQCYQYQKMFSMFKIDIKQFINENNNTNTQFSSKNISIINFPRQHNKQHQKYQYINRQKQTFSLSHFKGLVVLFRKLIQIEQNQILQQKLENILNQGIFMFGSHNFTSSAIYNIVEQNNRKYIKVKNSQLSLMFFDVPGIHYHVLPTSFDFNNYFRQSIYEVQKNRLYTQLFTPQIKKQNHDVFQIKLFKEDKYKIYKERQQKFKQIKQKLKQYYQNRKVKIVFDYPIIEGTDKILKQYILEDCDQQIKHNFSLYKKYLKQQCNKQRRQLYFSRDQNPDFRFCYQNNFKTIVVADFVIINDNNFIQQVWSIPLDIINPKKLFKGIRNKIRTTLTQNQIYFYQLNSEIFLQAMKKQIKNEIYTYIDYTKNKEMCKLLE